MPAYAVEFKGYDGSIAKAQLQCAYNRALMTEGARAVHTYIDKSDDDFYSKTQALTVVYNSDTVNSMAITLSRFLYRHNPLVVESTVA
jgi:hypothetical protein